MNVSTSPRIDILLATFNSAGHLESQLESILAQDYVNYRLLIRDGGSSDHTPQLIQNYQKRHPEKILYLGSETAGARENFSRLLDAATAELLMFSDHDDVWMPDKISRSVARYRLAEDEKGKEHPILLFTDRIVVDHKLNILAESSFQFQNLNPERTQFRQLLLQNIPPGNSMLFNRALKECAGPIHRHAVMHDHWLALAAAAFGTIVYLPEPTLFYRQHEKNIYGARRVALRYYLSLLKHGRSRIKSRQLANFRQGQAFLKRFSNRLPEELRDLLEDFARIPEAGLIRKRLLLLKHGIGKQGLIRTIGLYILL